MPSILTGRSGRDLWEDAAEDQPKPKVDDQVDDKSQKKVEELATKDDDDKGKTDEKKSVHHQEDQEKAKIGNGGSGEDYPKKTNLKEKEPEAEVASYDMQDIPSLWQNVVKQSMPNCTRQFQ